MTDMKEVWAAFDEWERTQVCIRGHVRLVREEIERLVKEHEELMFAAARLCNVHKWSYGGPETLEALADHIVSKKDGLGT